MSRLTSPWWRKRHRCRVESPPPSPPEPPPPLPQPRTYWRVYRIEPDGTETLVDGFPSSLQACEFMVRMNGEGSGGGRRCVYYVGWPPVSLPHLEVGPWRR